LPMDLLSPSPLVLSIIFFLVAFLYSSVGLGGGSSYTAILAIFNINYLAIPTITLTLNLFVTSVGNFNYIKNRHLRLRLFIPFLLASVPFSYLSGTLQLSKDTFWKILLICLVLVAIRIYFFKNSTFDLKVSRIQQFILSLVLGAILGTIAGVTGLGGGIFLVPFILIFGLGNVKEAAACGSAFIWVNSLSGILARIQYTAIDISYLPVILSVIMGGMLGSHLGASYFKPRTMEKILGLIIIIAIALIARKIIQG